MLRQLLFFFLFLPLALPAQTLRLITWNVQDLGRTTTPEEIDRMAQLVRWADVVAIQEVVARDPAGAQRIAALDAALDRTGQDWDYRVSDPTSCAVPQSRERYAFLWKRGKVDVIGYALDRSCADSVIREPYLLDLTVRGFPRPLRLVNFHSLPHDKEPAREFPYLLNSALPPARGGTIYLGDWNVTDDDPGLQVFYLRGYRSAVSGAPTTLKRACKDGYYLNYAIDNIFYPAGGYRFVGAGVIDFVRGCAWLGEDRALSDHLPVFLEIAPL